MHWPFVVVSLVAAASAFAADPLPARDLRIAPFTIAAQEPSSFDLVDFREDQQREAAMIPDVIPHTHFDIKRHVGVAAGFEGDIVHGSAGFYLTMAEWGRWNFGAPTIELGLGRYPYYDDRQRRLVPGDSWTVMVSLASVHYRIGWIDSIGANCYLNLEQVVDLHSNIAGSQIGFSFSRK